MIIIKSTQTTTNSAFIVSTRSPVGRNAEYCSQLYRYQWITGPHVPQFSGLLLDVHTLLKAIQ